MWRARIDVKILIYPYCTVLSFLSFCFVVLPILLAMIFLFVLKKKPSMWGELNPFFLSSHMYDDDVVKITNELYDPNARKNHLCNKKRILNREHRCGAGQIPSESQVKTSLTTLEC